MLPFSQCPYPWSTLMLFPDKTAAPCCCLIGGTWPRKFSYNESLRDIWTSTEFIQIRNEVINNTPNKKNACMNCGNLKDEILGMENINECFNAFTALKNDSIQKKIFESFKKCFNERNHYADSMPVEYSLIFSYACNLRCIMCNRDTMHESLSHQELNADWLIANAEHLRKATKIQISGGEPFFIQNSIKFLDWLLDDAKMSDMIVFVRTNALAMKRFIPRMKNHNVILQASLDSHGRHYESVRRGSSWEKVSKNIDAYLNALGSRTIVKGESNVKVMCTLTKTGLPGIFDLTRWVVDRGLKIVFKNADYRYGLSLDDESFGINPELLNKCDGWRDMMLRCIEYIEKNSPYPENAATLKSMVENFDRELEIKNEAKERFAALRRNALANDGFFKDVLSDFSDYQFNVYSENRDSGKLILDNALFFNHLTTDDHVSTQYFSISTDIQGRREFLLELNFPVIEESSCQFRIIIQDSACNCLAYLYPAIPQEEKTAEDKDRLRMYMPFVIENKALDKIRLVFSPKNKIGKIALPSRIRIGKAGR